MIRVLIMDDSYNRLCFWYDDIEEATHLISEALREGYKVEITTTKKEELDF